MDKAQQKFENSYTKTRNRNFLKNIAKIDIKQSNKSKVYL